MKDYGNRFRVEINDLIESWKDDPSWDIEDTEGFEHHREELLVIRKEWEERWEKEHKDRLEERAERLGCPGNLKLARYVEGLEARIKRIMDRLEKGRE